MNCPHCGSAERQSVKETRLGADGTINRRRRCSECGLDFQTAERLSESSLRVRKSDGRVVAFSRRAILTSLIEAAVRKYDPDRLNQLVDGVIADIYPTAEGGVVPSSVVGEAVLRHFRQFDEVSHIRFALVHIGRQDRSDGQPGWKDVNDVRRWLAEQYPQIRSYRPPTRLTEVVKRDGTYQPLDVAKLQRSIGIAAKGRGSHDDVDALAATVARDVEDALGDQPTVTSGQISAEILRSLRSRDNIAYLRFASTTKRFRGPEDYESEAAALRNH